MNLTNPEHPTPPRPGRLERALDGGFDPVRDGKPLEPTQVDMTSTDPWDVALQLIAIQTHEFTCTDCGRRCDSCDERMCATWGPEPEPRCPAHPTCTACAEMPSCRDCAVVLRDANEGTDW